MPDPRKYLFDLPVNDRPHDISIPEVWYPGVKDHWSQSTSSRIYDSILGVKAVVIHATAGARSSDAMGVMKAHKASWHWLVPDEDEAQHGNIVWACAPEARAAWHVKNTRSHPRVNGGRNKVNHWSLGIEIVNRVPVGGGDPYSNWQVEVTAEIVRYCWAKYPNLKQVVSHALLDPVNRRDPGEQFPWERFKKLVLEGSVDLAGDALVTAAAPMDSLISDPDINTCCMPT